MIGEIDPTPRRRKLTAAHARPQPSEQDVAKLLRHYGVGGERGDRPSRTPPTSPRTRRAFGSSLVFGLLEDAAMDEEESREFMASLADQL
ncbi:hypothetical protein [Nonomuraea sp. NPDC049646]|uniref:hypothetical protein n=1 Tax=unclassified Nonomuraea TaxID=2593643 RepID=UPI00379C442D